MEVWRQANKTLMDTANEKQFTSVVRLKNSFNLLMLAFVFAGTQFYLEKTVVAALGIYA